MVVVVVAVAVVEIFIPGIAFPWVIGMGYEPCWSS